MPKKKQSKGTDELTKLRARVAKAPQKPGIYRWLNKAGDPLYIGKAKNLRNRMKAYLPPVASAKGGVSKEADKSLGPWKQALIKSIADVDWTITKTELEALILETNLIKENKPKYNVLMKDDKNYVYVKISMHDTFPSVSVVRQLEEKEARYFGPFLSATKVYRALDLLHDVFQFRACKRSIDQLNRNPNVETKRCVESQIGKCNGLCQNKLSRDEYRERIEEVNRFFRGDRKHVINKLKTMMEEASLNKKFEQAAKLRDTLDWLKTLEEQQVVSDTSGANTDAIGIALMSGKAHVVILQERNGKLINELSFSLKGEADTAAEVLSQFLPQYYEDVPEPPETILISAPIEEEEIELFEQWINETRLHSERTTTVHVPARGKKSKLLKMAEENAKENVQKQFATWEAEAKNIELALSDLKDTLELKGIPKRIECYDISHLDGTETVGSMVVFVNGKPKNEHYRNFTIRTLKKGVIDDYKALQEVLSRRLRHLTEAQRQEEERWKREGIEIRRAKKAEQKDLEEIHKENEKTMSQKNIDYQDYIVARHENDLVGFGRVSTNEKKIAELKSLWVRDEYRGGKFGHTITKKLLSRVKSGKVYITTDPNLESYYAHLGFRHVITPPEFLSEQMEWIQKNKPTLPHGMIMMYDSAQNKIDASLTATPDLIILDGGKGQLSTGVEVLNNMKLEIPIISLAKREEEVFLPGNNLPTAMSEHARFLLMRLRDEAHRFANRHREKRVKNALI